MRTTSSRSTVYSTVVPALGLGLMLVSSASSATTTGPIAGTPSTAAPVDLAAVGYVEEEFFIEGMATAYASADALVSNGHWTVTPASAAAYRTRILVRRPAEAGDFSGAVVAEWFNVSGGFDIDPDFRYMSAELIREGAAWVGVSAQSVGVEALRGSRPPRYGSLVHPGDDYSYDIFSQAARAVLQPSGVDPLAGLAPTMLLAAGESQSAGRLTTYVDALQPIDGLYDGFLIHSRFGSAAPLSNAQMAPSPTLIRTDLDVPVLTVQTEGDLLLLGSLIARQADGDRLRFWEIPGNSHADVFVLGGIDPSFLGCDLPINDGPQHYVVRAGVHHLIRWVRDDVLPPTAPFIETASELPVVLARDAFGNALGGIRTPQLDVPIASHSGEANSGNGFCFLFGSTLPFDDATLATLYPTHESYVSPFGLATDAAVTAGFILEPEGEELKREAEESSIGVPEPESWQLGAAALASLGLLARRRLGSLPTRHGRRPKETMDGARAGDRDVAGLPRSGCRANGR